MTDRRIFFDLDGVLADLDGAYESLFGIRPNINSGIDPPNFWDNVKAQDRFFRHLNLMPDARRLWDGTQALVQHRLGRQFFDPTLRVLTGIPKAEHNMPTVADQKRDWVEAHFGPDVPVTCCESIEKSRYGRPGDILIDDRTAYQQHWADMGGIYILHENAEQTLRELGALVAQWTLDARRP